MNRPKGFNNYPQVIPVKEKSYYTAGTFNGSLGVNNSREGWLLWKTTPYPTTGKDITLDFAVWRNTNYFDFTGPHVDIYIRFYSMIKKQFDSEWTLLSGPHSIGGTSPAGVPGASASNWDSYSTYGSHKPAYGVQSVGQGSERVWVPPSGDEEEGHYTTKYYDILDRYLWSSYSAFESDCKRNGKSMHIWDPSEDHYRSYTLTMPFGLRYISNNGKWGPGKTHVDPNGVISRDGQTSASWSQSNQDGGNTPSNFKHIEITKDFIKQVHGKVAGVTAFQIKITVGTSNVYSSWIFGSTDVLHPELDQGIHTMIDHPQIGLLDWGAAGSPEDWPERFDAKAYYADGSAEGKELQAELGGPDKEWEIF